MYQVDITLKLVATKAGLGTAITARYFDTSAPPVQVGTDKTDGVLEEIGGGRYQFHDAAVPDAARMVKFYKSADGAFLEATSIEPPPELGAASLQVDMHEERTG